MTPVVAPAPGLSVLVVDDDADVAEMLTLILEGAGARVTACTRPAAAVAAAVASRYDVLIVDLLMPELDGLELLRRLRAAGVTTPALLLTGRRGVAAELTLDGLGIARCLEKPVGLDGLLGAVAAVGGAGRATGASGSA